MTSGHPTSSRLEKLAERCDHVLAELDLLAGQIEEALQRHDATTDADRDDRSC